ncbi:hypothetical protein ACFOPQ_01255 [Deinococcus antarcticus]|uniref:Uncharacterized protein n=1 Tax=Deinococcus antarcticus TaxID=1298767 RepID=A0ABV8A173_9DEIO
MDDQTLQLVKHFVRPDAWPTWESFFSDAEKQSEAENLALDVEGTPQNLAAYILETLADSATRTDASGAAQVKRLKDGAEELEYFQGRSVSAADAAIFTARAAKLRQGGPAQNPGTANPAPVLDPWGIA